MGNSGTPEAVVHLHADLYPRDCVDTAAAAFGAFGTFAVETVAPYHRVRIVAAGPLGPERLAQEFANHALAAAAASRSSSA